MKEKELLQCCLYFTSNSLARVLTTMAEDAFRPTGMSPNYAFLLMLVCEKPGISQKEIGEHLQLSPSTITRFVDKLEAKGYMGRTVNGKTTLLHPTEDGQGLLQAIYDSWARLYNQYSDILGEDAGKSLTEATWKATLELEGK
jgi:DNA-binding MarR family transcriptional regulator